MILISLVFEAGAVLFGVILVGIGLYLIIFGIKDRLPTRMIVSSFLFGGFFMVFGGFILAPFFRALLNIF